LLPYPPHPRPLIVEGSVPCRIRVQTTVPSSSHHSTSPAAPAAATLTLQIAGLPGPAFQLDPVAENILGRAAGSLIVLADRLASRRHAGVRFDAAREAWLIKDLESRNGTWLDESRVTEEPLADGSIIRVGTTELVFRSTAPVTAQTDDDARVVRCGPPDALEGEALQRAGGNGDPRWPMFLYQAGFRLLAADSSQTIVGATLELAAEFTAAASFGWFELSADRLPVPVCVVPPGSDLPALLTGRGWQEAIAGRGIWLTPQADAGGLALACVPVIAGGRVEAVLAATAPTGLKDVDFDLLVSLASLAGAARAGRDAAARAGAEEPASTEPFDDAAVGGDPAAQSADGTLALSEYEAELLHGAAASLLAHSESLRLEDWERRLAIEALRRSDGSVPEAATLLGISRATLYRRLDGLGLKRDEPSADPG